MVKQMRKRIYEIIEKAEDNDKISKLYDAFMMLSIIASIIPLCFVDQYILNVLSKKKGALLTVGMLALSYIFVTALIVFQVEPDTFGDFFKAIYWATVSLTTVGYGDIYPTSDIGRIISMVSSFLGIAIVALPSGIIIPGYQDEIEK